MSLNETSISPYVFPGLKLDEEDSRLLKSSFKHLKYKISKEDLLKIVADECGVTTSQIVSRIREREIVNGRFMYCAIMNMSFGYTLKKIGEIMDGRDHTTILHAVEAFKDRYRNEDTFRGSVNRIYRKLGI
jgi:chromosomal replication initiator protein